MMKVKWILQKPLADKQQLAHFEQEHHISFPKDFIEVIHDNHGGRPRPNVFDTSLRKELIAKSLLSFDKADMDNIWETCESLKAYLPEGMIPFMSDQFGNYLCFDYRHGGEPTVVFWDHEVPDANPERRISFVSDNFTDFINSLYDVL